jgi:hypothetical protein
MNQKQLNRLLELSNIKGTSMKESTGKNFGAIELIKKAADGKTYAIVRENRNYYIKTTETKETLKESDFNFIGGVQNKTKNSFRSFEDATSRLNLMFNDINRTYGIRESIDMKTFDYVINESGEYVTHEGMDPRIQGAASAMRKDPSRDKKDTRDKYGLGDEEQNEGDQKEKDDDTEILMDNEKEELQEKRFILKQPKPKKSEEPMDFGGGAEEEGGDFDFGGEDTGGEDEFDFGGEGEDTEGGDEFDFGGEGEDTEGGEEEFDFDAEGGEDTEGGEEEFDFDAEGGEEDMEMGDEGDPIKDIQRTTGKLGQQLRDTEDLSSDMQKYVVNSVLSALDLSKMDSNDKDSIINKIESGESSEEGEDIDFMEDDYQVEYQGGRTFEDEDERGGEPELESGEEILLDDEDEGPGGYLGFEDYSDEMEDIPMTQIDMPIQDKGYLNIDPDVASGNVDYMDDDKEYVEIEGPMSYMTDDMMEECGPGVDCGDPMEEGMTSWMDSDDTGGMGSDDGSSEGLGWEHGGGGVSEGTSYMGDDYTEEELDRMFGNTDTYNMNNPSTEPAEPTTKPDVKPERPTRPSTTPFSPPERIRPGEEPRPKAAQPSEEPAPTTAPPTTRPERPTRPSTTPFSPPERIRPGEEPRPKADYDDDVTFE